MKQHERTMGRTGFEMPEDFCQEARKGGCVASCTPVLPSGSLQPSLQSLRSACRRSSLARRLPPCADVISLLLRQVPFRAGNVLGIVAGTAGEHSPQRHSHVPGPGIHPGMERFLEAAEGSAMMRMMRRRMKGCKHDPVPRWSALPSGLSISWRQRQRDRNDNLVITGLV